MLQQAFTFRRIFGSSLRAIRFALHAVVRHLDAVIAGAAYAAFVAIGLLSMLS